MLKISDKKLKYLEENDLPNMIPPKLPKPNNPPRPILEKPVLKPVLMKGRKVRVPLFRTGRKPRLVPVVTLLPWTVAVAELLELTLTVTPLPVPVPVVLAAVTMVVVEEELPVSWDSRPEKANPSSVPRTIIIGRRVRKMGVKSTYIMYRIN